MTYPIPSGKALQQPEEKSWRRVTTALWCEVTQAQAGMAATRASVVRKAPRSEPASP